MSFPLLANKEYRGRIIRGQCQAEMSSEANVGQPSGSFQPLFRVSEASASLNTTHSSSLVQAGSFDFFSFTGANRRAIRHITSMACVESPCRESQPDNLDAPLGAWCIAYRLNMPGVSSPIPRVRQPFYLTPPEKEALPCTRMQLTLLPHLCCINYGPWDVVARPYRRAARG